MKADIYHYACVSKYVKRSDLCQIVRLCDKKLTFYRAWLGATTPVCKYSQIYEKYGKIQSELQVLRNCCANCRSLETRNGLVFLVDSFIAHYYVHIYGAS